MLRLKTGVKQDGTIVAHEMDAYLDSGAYGGFRPGAVVGGIAHAGGCYRAEHARISVSRVYTNNIPGGQMRAPGEPQGFFAAESHMDCVARAFGWTRWTSPQEFDRGRRIDVTGGHYQRHQSEETLKAAAKPTAYTSPKPRTVGRGVAMGSSGAGGGNTSLRSRSTRWIGSHPDIFIRAGTRTYTT